MSRKTIGRQLNSQATVESSSATRVQYFTLKTGRKVKFSLMTIPAQDVANKTFVQQETNGRDQTALTKHSLKEIINTIRFQQYFACIGVQQKDKIEILDGSRRRAAALFAHTALEIMVTSERLSVEEARQLAKDIQTAKEHNLREIGLRLMALKSKGLNQKEIADQEGISQAKVTRALQAATVSQTLISLFPVQSELAYSDYRGLLDIEENLAVKGIAIQQLLEMISPELDEIAAHEQCPEDDKKSAILKLISRGVTSLIASPVKEKPVITQLWEFQDRDRFARKRIKGRAFSYEFNRLNKDVQQELDQAIDDILTRHFKKENSPA